LLDDGSVVLIVDVEDLLRSVDKLLSTGRLERIERGSSRPGVRASACWWSTTR
jgi:chemotaxis protein histidine kinase CheA